MDLGNTTALIEQLDGCSTGEVLDELSRSRTARRLAEVSEWIAVVAWADRNTATDLADVATIREGVVDTGMLIAGPGAPLVSEFAFHEVAAVLGRSKDSARIHVGRILEVAWRLTTIYAAVLDGRCEPYRAMLVADQTRKLSLEAAAFVDRQLGFAIRTCTMRQIEGLITEAMVRFDPEVAELHREDAGLGRRFDIHLDHIGPDGLVPVDGLLDAADAADLDQAVNRRAVLLGQLGNDESLDVRRSIAAGELARADLTLDLHAEDPDGNQVTSPGRKVELVLHVSQAAVEGTAGGEVARWENNHQQPISTTQIRAWIHDTATTVVVRPVLDLAGHVPVGSWEIPDRLKQQVRWRDQHCRFPFCNKPAERCDTDHAIPFHAGGTTCGCNLVAACRSHHRAKTFSDWRYTIIDPGSYLWISPNGRHWLVDHHGTRALDPPRRLMPDSMDVVHDYETTQPTPYVTEPCPGTLLDLDPAPE